ncbi:MAG TPA: PTS sugar transporter subunit IIB [Symbiobacteriaceae bacterium]|nr:PTS sugar transporter subunit IIB [Symbiobacteriaceae bacterium]
MTVIHMRIDNRLIHGQVTVSWVNSMAANHMIVCNDKVAVDPIQKIMLPQAARGVRTSVLSIKDTLQYCASPEGQPEQILLIAKFPADGLALLEGGLQPKEINVGNQAPIGGTQFKMVTNTIAVTADDAAKYRAIAEKGYRLTYKMMPSDSAGDFLQLLAKKGF